MSIYSRANYLLVDKLGLDELSSTIVPEFYKLPPELQVYVDDSTEGRPSLIAWRVYQSVDAWWVVLEYNGILHSSEMLAGQLLKLPSPASLRTLFERVSSTGESSDSSTASKVAARRRRRSITV